MITRNRRIILIVSAVAIILLLPFIAMKFTTEVNWTSFDFLTAGVLLLGAGLMLELIIRQVRNKRYRFVLCGILLVAFLLVWLELAVGVFGTIFSGS